MAMQRFGLFQGGGTWLWLTATWSLKWILPFALSFFSATCLTGLLVRNAPKRGWVSVPRQDRWSVRVVAQYGGIPLLLAVSISVLCFFPTRQNLILMLLTWGMAFIGLRDDLARLTPKAKLLGQLLVASLAIYGGIIHPVTRHYWIDLFFTIFWIVGVTNAINLLDNMDGLAAGIAIIASAAIILLAGPASPISDLMLCLLASVAGFLVFNFNPAKVFMGDVGALSIGFLLACASVKTAEQFSGVGSVMFVPCLILFIPVFDTALVSVTRRIGGRRISLGARDHVSHRLVWMGLSERKAASLLYVIAATAGLMGFLWKLSRGDLGAGIVALFLIGSALFWIYLAKLQLPAAWLSPPDPRIAPIPQYLQRMMTGAFFILLDAAVIGLGLYFAFLVKFERLDRILLGRFFFTAALAIAIKLPLLIIFAVSEHKWTITRRRDVHPILKSVVLAAFLLTAVSAALPKSKAIESSIILFDAVFTCVLLVVGRASGRIFDDLFGKQNLLDLTVKRLANWSRLRPSDGSLHDGSADEVASEEAPATDPEMERRPN